VTVETVKDFGPGAMGRVQRWLDELQASGNWLHDWHDRCERIMERYVNEQASPGAGFNVLWPNTEILRAALYGQRPRPDVRRRGNKADPLGRACAQIIEGALEFLWDSQTHPVDGQIQAMLTDHMIAGAGILRVRYVPQWVRRREPVMRQDDDDGRARFFSTLLDEIDANDVIEADGEAYTELEELHFERADVEHVYYRDFRWGPCRAWRDCRWVAFRHEFTFEQLKEAFGPAKAARCALTISGRDAQDGRDTPAFFKTALVWEIWDKETRKVLFVSPGMVDAPLAEFDDVCNLREFFPTPGLFRSVERTDSTLPTPEFLLYQDQALELDDLTARISALMEQIRVAGFYDASLENIPDVMRAQNKLIPIANWQALVERGGIDGAISWIPIEQAVAALQVLYQQRQILLDTIYQIIGLSDIARGSTDPRETATAQQIKGQFGSLRLQPRQRALQAYLRDIMRLQAELVAEKFEPSTLMQMTGRPLTEEMVLLLRADALRRFAVDIETDSTIAVDEQAQKAQAIEFFGAMAQFVQAAAPMAQSGIVAPEAVRGMLLHGARIFKLGRELEEQLEQPGQPPQTEQAPPDPAAMAKAQVDMTNAETKRMDVMQRGELERTKLAIEAEKVGLSEREMEAQRMLDVLDRVRGGNAA
jgi:DnaJ-domain-containing protein 1